MRISAFTASLSLFAAWSLFLGSSLVSAHDIPGFPSCPAPGGTLQVQYASGDHGIPGDFSTHTGSDSVFLINDSQLVQCFCTSDGTSGIQTNWWKTSSISQDEIDTLRNLGWIFVPDGSLWGLQSAPYMAFNTPNNCSIPSNPPSSSSSSSAPGPGSAPVCDSAVPPAPTLISVSRNDSTATLTWTKVDQATTYLIFYGTQPGRQDYSVPDTGNVTTYTIGSLNPNQQYYFDVRSVNNCMPSAAAAGIGGGQVLGSSTFAPTGNMLTLVVVAGLGIVLLALSFVSRRLHHREA